jgi:hypothetical protein
MHSKELHHMIFLLPLPSFLVSLVRFFWLSITKFGIIFANKSAPLSESPSEFSPESSSETPTCLLSFDEPSTLQLMLVPPEE